MQRNKVNIFKHRIRTDEREKKRSIITKEMIISSILLLLIGVSIAAFQSRIPKFFGATVPITLAYVCALGFLFGEKYGAVGGTLLGFLLDCNGGVDFSLCVLLYMLCGFLCGGLKGKFLSEGLPSFWVFALVAGIFNSSATAVYFVLFSDELSPVRLLFTLMPEFISYAFICPVMYLVVYPITKIKKTK